MPVYSVQGPDGRIYDVEGPEGASESDIIDAVKRDIAARAVAQPKRKKGLLAAAEKGLESVISSGRTAYEALTGSPEEAARRGLERGEDIEKRFADQVSLERVKKAYAERGLLPAAGEAISQVPAAIAEQAPNIATALGGARLGATLGGVAGPVGGVVGGIAGAALPSLIQQFGGNIERQAAEQQRRGEPVRIDTGAAAAAAAPQAALDVAGTFIPLGGRLVSKLTGIPTEALLGRSAAQISKLADERLLKTLAKGTAVGAVAEIPTEIAQQMLERAQAGLSLTSPDALKEYGETAYQVGLLAPIGAAGRLSERAGARQEMDIRAADEQRRAQEAELAQQAEEQRKAADLAAADEARKQTPEYALQFGQQYDALQKQFADLKGQMKKPSADATFEEKAAYKEQQTQLKELAKKLTEQTPEYRRIKSVYQDELNRLQQEETARQEARLQKLEQEAAATQEAAIEPYYQSPQGTLFGFGAPAPEAAPTELPDYKRQQELLKAQIDELRIRAQQTTNLDEKLALGEQYTRLEAARKEAEKLAKEASAPTPDKQIKSLRAKMLLAEEQGDIEAQVKIAQKLKDLGVADLTAEPEQIGLDLGRATQQQFVESKPSFAARVYEPGAADIEAQEAALREEQEQADEAARQETLREQRIAPEIFKLQQIAARPAGPDLDVRAALPLERMQPAGGAAIGMMQQRLRLESALTAARERLKKARADFTNTPTTQAELDAATANYNKEQERYRKALAEMRQTELIPTAEEEGKPATPRRVPGTGELRLFPRRPDYTDMSPRAVQARARALAQRLARALARPDLTDDAYAFLSRAEKVMPQAEFQMSEERIKRDREGVMRDIASTRGFLELLDEQLTRIERGQEGVPTPSARRYREERGVLFSTRYPEGRMPARRRIEEDVTDRTLRVPPAPLSLQAEMEPLVAALEQASQDIVGIQQGLFPEEEKKLGAIKTDRAEFVRFMNSPFVRTLKKNLTRAADDAAKARKELPPLRAKIEALTKKLTEMREAQSKYVSAQAVLKEKELLINTTEDVATINAALTDMVTQRMELSGTIEQLEADIRRLQDEAAQWGAWGETTSAPFVNDLRNKLQELRGYQQDLTSLDSYAKWVNQTLRMLKAENTIADLRNKAPFPAEIAQAEKELQAALAEAGVLQSKESKARVDEIRAAAEKRRADQAVDRAQRERASVERAKEAQKRLEAMYGDAATGLQYPAITEAQRFARDVGTPPITPQSLVKEGEDPRQVLGGVRSYITRLERIMMRAQDRSMQFRNAELAPLEKAVKNLEAQLRAEKSADKREALLAKIEKASDAYQDAAAKLATEPLTWKGMKSQIRALSQAYNRAEALERGIQNGTLALPEERAPRSAKVKLSKGEKQAAAETAAKEEATEAAKRAEAPATSGEALTKTEVAQRSKAQKTQYSSKGVGEEAQQRAAEEVRVKAALEQLKASTLTLGESTTKKKEVWTSYPVMYEGKPATLTIMRGKDNPDQVAGVRIKVDGENLAAVNLDAQGVQTDAKVLSNLLDTDIVELRTDAIQRAADRMRRIANLFDQSNDPEALSQAANTAATGPALQEPVDVEQSAGAVMNNIANTSSDPITRAIAERLKMLLGATRVEIVNDLRDDKGNPIFGSATVDGRRISLDRSAGLNEQTVVHEGIHSATERVLRMPEDQLTPDQLAAKRELEELYKAYMADKTAPNANAKNNMSEFLSEALSDNELKGYLQSKPWTLKNMWESLKNGILQMLGIKTPKNMLEATLAVADRLMTRVPRATPADMQLYPARLSRPKTLSPGLQAALSTADQIVAKQRTWSDKVKANATGLAFETQLVDRFAGFERLAKYMDKLKGMQMLYYLRMYDQRMNFVAQSVGTGALDLVKKTRKDGAVEYVIESQPGASIAGVARILKDANPILGNVDNTNRLFTMYLAAKRAERVGFSKLNFGDALTEAKLRRDVAAIEATPGLKSIFERARNEYNKYNEGLVRFAEKAGAIKKDVADELLKSKDYIPYYRQRQDGVVELMIGGETPITVGSIKSQPYLKDLIGGETAILDFMRSSVQNTNMLVDMSLRNLATKNAMYELVEIGAAKITGVTSGPDVVQFKENGVDKYAVIDTGKFDIPADLLVKGMEGIPLQTTGLLHAMSLPAKFLRKAVTLNPLYSARQLFRDSLAAYIMSGADTVPVFGALKEIGSAAAKTLERRGITGGQQFTGTQEDLSLILRQITSGQGSLATLLGKAEAFSMEADALTRRAQYNAYIRQGLSEMEATLLALESMNFNKRGASPSIHAANALIPFFNAQIQGLNVLYKAMFGKASVAEKARIREKLITRGLMLMAVSLAYTHAMQDDEAYKNALPDQKYGNWFIRIPGIAEPLRLPIPFEIGYIFKALPEALYNSLMSKEGAEGAQEALLNIVRNVIPGGGSYFIPQAAKPAIEALLNRSFFTGRDIVSTKEQKLLPEAQYRESTTELAKLFGGLGLSPIKFEALVNGYTGPLGMALLGALSLPISTADSPEKAAKRLSDLPVFGGAFQPNDASWIINNTYDSLKEAQQVEQTFKDYLARGEKARAVELINTRANDYAMANFGDYYAQTMRKLTQLETAVKASDRSPEEKREMLDNIRQQKIKFAGMVREASERTTPR